MLRFTFRQVRLDGLDRFYAPLPKMHLGQLSYLSEHLRSRGFSVQTRELLQGRKGDTAVTVSASGLAWSGDDLTDVLAPAVPGILSQGREAAPGNPYFSSGGPDRHAIRLSPRMEGMRLWTELRKEGKSGLTEDEASVLARLLEGLGGGIECVTDYPGVDAVAFRVGRVQLFTAKLPVGEFLANLAVVGRSSPRRAFLPRSSVLRLDRRLPPGNLMIPAGELGEWCYLDF